MKEILSLAIYVIYIYLSVSSRSSTYISSLSYMYIHTYMHIYIHVRMDIVYT